MILLFIVNTPEFFLSHRLPIALAAQKAGYEVHVATGKGKAGAIISAKGFFFHPLPISRGRNNPGAEILAIFKIWRVLKKVKPDLVHLVTVKPVLYGGILARFVRVPGVVAAISGLGSIFVPRGRLDKFFRISVEWLYRQALHHPNIKVIFQNESDRQTLVNISAIFPRDCVLVPGSGVALNDYAVLPEPDNVPIVTFAARLLRDKGIVEFVEAARLLKAKGVSARFWVVGAPDEGNPSSVSWKLLDQWREEGVVELKGFCSDIRRIFQETAIVVLPSYYGEGLPKVLIEAAASGRCIVTTDHPGCRDAVVDGETGVLVPARNVGVLAKEIEKLLCDPVKRAAMGRKGRGLAERRFSVDTVIDTHMNIYNELLEKKRGGGCD